jgi:hypothetical protein
MTEKLPEQLYSMTALPDCKDNGSRPSIQKQRRCMRFITSHFTQQILLNAVGQILAPACVADEAISVRAIEPPALSEHRRQEQFEQLRKYFAELGSRREPGSAEEADEILTEAIRSTRPSYRPHR